MKKLVVYIFAFWILLPVASQAMLKKTFNINNTFSHANTFFNKQNFHTSAPTQNLTSVFALLTLAFLLDDNVWPKKFNKPSVDIHNQFTQLNKQFDKINKQQNWDNPFWSERKVSPDDIEAILHIITNIKSKDINELIDLNKPMDWPDNTFLSTCIKKTSYFPDADAEKVIKKLIERGTSIDNPKAHYFPLWSAVLNGNFGAYNVMLNHAKEVHLFRPYSDEVLNLSHVIVFGLKRLKIMEDYYTAESQKIKNGEKIGYSYKHSFLNMSMPYDKAVTRNLKRIIWFKNRFQKIQDLNTIYYSSKSKYNLIIPADIEPFINNFLEEQVLPFHEYAHGKMYKDSIEKLDN